jgi:sulfotransferase family protein
MAVEVIGAGVDRTGTHSLKQAPEQLRGGRCHHMVEIIGDPAGSTDAVEGREVDWGQVLDGYVAVVDWSGASFWREISAGEPRRARAALDARSGGLVPQRLRHHLRLITAEGTAETSRIGSRR